YSNNYPIKPISKGQRKVASFLNASSVPNDQLKDVAISYKLEDLEATRLTMDTASVNDFTVTPKNDNEQDNTAIQIRKNFNETAFFFPDLHTDSSGAIEFSFTIP